MLFALVAGIAGVFIGLSLCAAFVIQMQMQQIKGLDAERMRLWNKALVRDAQSPLFSEKAIAGDDYEKPVPFATNTATSPFRAGLTKLRKRIDGEGKPNVPQNVVDAVNNAAEKVKGAAA
jgi:hypothetical protein